MTEFVALNCISMSHRPCETPYQGIVNLVRHSRQAFLKAAHRGIQFGTRALGTPTGCTRQG